METSDDNNIVKKKWIIAGSVISVLVLGVVIWVVMKYVVHHSHSAYRKAANQSDIGGVHFNNLTPSIPSGPTNNSHIEITAQDTRYNLGSKITVKWINANYSKPVYWYFVGPSKKVLIKNHTGNIATNFVIPEEVSFTGACKVVITDNYTTPTFSIHSSVFTTHVKLNFVNWNTTFYNKNVCNIGLSTDSKIDFSLYTVTCYKDNKPFGQPIKAQSISLSAGNSGNLELEFTPEFTEAQVSCNLLVTAQIDGLTQTSGISSQTFTFKSKPAPSANKIVLTSKSGGDTFHYDSVVNIEITLPLEATWNDVTSITVTDNNTISTNVPLSDTKSNIPKHAAPNTVYGQWKSLSLKNRTAISFTMVIQLYIKGQEYSATTQTSYHIEDVLYVSNVNRDYTLFYWDKNSLGTSGYIPISSRSQFVCELSTVETGSMTWTMELIGTSTVSRTIVSSLHPNMTSSDKKTGFFQNTKNPYQYIISFWLDNTNPISITGEVKLKLICVTSDTTYTSAEYPITISSLKSWEQHVSPITSMKGFDFYAQPNEDDTLTSLKCDTFHQNLGNQFSFDFTSFSGDVAVGKIRLVYPGTKLNNNLISVSPSLPEVFVFPKNTNNFNTVHVIDTSTTIPYVSIACVVNGTVEDHYIYIKDVNNAGIPMQSNNPSSFISLVLSDYFYYKISGSYDHWFENVNYFKNPCTCALQGVCTK